MGLYLCVAGVGCRSYHEWRDEKEHGKPEAVGAPGTSPAATAAGSAGGGDGGSSSGGVGDAVKGLGREAGDTAQAAQEVVKMEGRAAGGWWVFCSFCIWGLSSDQCTEYDSAVRTGCVSTQSRVRLARWLAGLFAVSVCVKRGVCI